MKKATAKSVKKQGKVVQFLQKSTCPTCRKARKSMTRRGYRLKMRDIVKEPLSSSELEKLIGTRDHTQFLNPRSEVYRREEMKEEPPSRREAIRLMAKEPGLIRRPIILAGGRVVVGFGDKGEVNWF